MNKQFKSKSNDLIIQLNSLIIIYRTINFYNKKYVKK